MGRRTSSAHTVETSTSRPNVMPEGVIGVEEETPHPNRANRLRPGRSKRRHDQTGPKGSGMRGRDFRPAAACDSSRSDAT